MKLKTAAPLLLFLFLSGPALAETTASYPGEANCSMTGHASRVSEECKAFRLAFRAEVNACMDRLLLASRTSWGAAMNSQTNRSRFLICDADVRAKLGVPLN
jgi:hypothetical protein